MQVREIMTPDPACCTPDSSVADVARMMKENDCGCIPVVNSLTDLKPVGTITDRDITIRTVAENQNPIGLRASDIMTTDIATVTPDMSLEKCFDVMEDREIRRVLVVDEQGRCTGIVAQADVVQSNANPARTNKVIREISESAPSPNRSVRIGRQTNEANFGSDSSSFLSSDTLLPLLIGLGSGVALMYLLSDRRSAPRRESIGDRNAYSFEHENRMDLTDQENFGRYVDAEQEVEKRQQDLENRVQTLRTQPDSPMNTRADSLKPEDDEAVTKDKGRSAGQGS